VCWTDATYAELRQSIEQEAAEGSLRAAALRRVAILDCGRRDDDTLAPCDPSAAPPDTVQQWKKMIEAASIDRGCYAKVLTSILGDLICSDKADRIYVLRELLRNKHLFDTREEMPALAKRITSAECPVSTALTDADQRNLAPAAEKRARSP
jgi:hypothetical protein